MNNIAYRLIFRGFASGTHLKEAVYSLRKERVIPAEQQHAFLINPPRIIQEYETQHRAEQVQASLAKTGCLSILEPVVKYPSFPHSLSLKNDQIIKRELSKILRTRSSLVMLLVRIKPPDPRIVYPSMLSFWEDQAPGFYRESDTVIGIDDSRFAILGFASDKHGVIPLQNKTLRILKQILGTDVQVTFGHSVFPAEAQTLERLLCMATLPRDDIPPGLPPEAPQTASFPGQASKPALHKQDGSSPLQLCFIRGRGRIFNRLLTMDPQILWLGLSRIPRADQDQFLTRLPFDSPLVPVLENLIGKQSKPAIHRQAEDHFNAIIHQMALEPGITRRDVMAAKVMSILKQSNDLPTLPSVANQIFSIASDPNSSATELADLISRDPALTSKLLKTVNSAFYGSPQKISSVKYAISLLGTEEIVDLSFGLAAAKVFDFQYLKEIINPQLLWHHSFCTALIARYIYRDLTGQKNEGVFSAGLLHDVGKIFFVEHFTDPYRKIHQDAKEHGQPIFEFEEDDLGLNHAMAGNYLAIRWNLPEALTHAIAYHHQPLAAPDHSELAAVTGLADYLYYRAVDMDNPGTEKAAHQHGMTYGHYLFLSRLFENFNEGSLEDMTRNARAIVEESRSTITPFS